MLTIIQCEEPLPIGSYQGGDDSFTSDHEGTRHQGVRFRVAREATREEFLQQARDYGYTEDPCDIACHYLYAVEMD